MASDHRLLERLTKLIYERPGVAPWRTFGETRFMLNGNMCVGVHKDSLIIRIGAAQADKLLTRPHVKPMDLTEKIMRGWVEVQSEGIQQDMDLLRYAELALAFVSTLPAKETGVPRRPAPRPRA